VVVGDEVLRGACSDVNTPLLAKALRAHGVSLEAVAIVGDDSDAITQEIRSMIRRVDVVFTSGGLGPTHDDVTLTALAAALGLPLEPHPHMLRLIKQGHFVKKKPTNTEEEQQEVSANPPAGAVAPVPAAAAAGGVDAVVDLEDFSDAQKAMATFPKGSWLRMPSPVKPGDKPWPVLQCGKVFALPGVPTFFAQKVSAIVGGFLGPPRHTHASARKVTLCVDEAKLALLISAAAQAHPLVKVGSYPYYFDASTGHPKCSTVVTFDASAAAAAVEASKDGSSSSDAAIGAATGAAVAGRNAAAEAAEACRAALLASIESAGLLGESAAGKALLEDGDDLPPSKN